MSSLRAENIFVRRGSSTILSNATFHIQSGEFVGLIGPNGAGKTTLLQTMVGLQSIQQGTVMHDDIAVDSNSSHHFAKSISYLEQSGRSHWPITVKNLVMLGRLPHQKRWQLLSEKDHAASENAMKMCDVSEFAERRVNSLSGGEQARVMLARALATEPKILLADEPVAGLDPAHQLDVMDKLRKLSKEGTGIVVVMHDLGLAARYCDRLSLLYKGELVEEGAAETVLSDANLKKYYGIIARYEQTEFGPFVIPWKRASK